VTLAPITGDKVGRYRLGEAIGSGAVGVVYRAVAEPRGTVVALKLLRSELAGSRLYRRRFEHEARVARTVRHRNLVPVLDAGEVDGVPYLATRFVAGPSLAEALRRGGPLALERVLRVAADVAAGLGALHRRKLVHRDVKPANILLAEDGTALLTDFGLAKGEALTLLTAPGQVVGTPQYLAPELVDGSAEASPASDVYALGCVVYECLAGRPPFTGNTLEIALAHLTDDPPPIETIAAGLREALLTALRKDPAARPRTPTMYAHLLRAGAAVV
jgi:serine/threonine-protein kinase